MNNEINFACQFNDCRLLLQNPITLPCGYTLCNDHLNEIEDSFACWFCNRQHSRPEHGFSVNIILNNLISNLNQAQNGAKEVLDKLVSTIKDYEIINSAFIYDYFFDVKTEFDINRELLDSSPTLTENEKCIQKNKSYEIIERLKKIQRECEQNANSLVKLDFTDFKNESIRLWKYRIRDVRTQSDELKLIKSQMNRKIKEIEKNIRNYQENLLMGKKYKYGPSESGLCGELIESSIDPIFLDNFGTLYRSFNGHIDTIRAFKEDVNLNRLITSSDDRLIKILDLDSGDCLAALNEHQDWVTCLLLISDKLISGSKDKKIKIWNLRTFECEKTLDNESDVSSLCLLTNNRFASASINNGLINIWDLNSYNKLNSFTLTNGIRCLVSTNETIICGSIKGEIILIDSNSLTQIATLNGHSKEIHSLEIDHEGNLFSSSYDNSVKKWNLETCTSINKTFGRGIIKCVKVIKNNILAIGFQNREILIYDFDKENENAELKRMLDTHSKYVSKLDLLSDGSLVSGSGAGQIKLWNMLR